MRRYTPETNIVLIGMPGVGKSTLGVMLAKWLSRQFIDTDVFIQAHEGHRLQTIIDESGLDVFRAVEERYVCMLDVEAHVVATGGSVVYSEAAMSHLREDGYIVHLYLPFDELESRLTDLDTRGVVRAPGQSMQQLFDERIPLYRRHADLEIPCTGADHEQLVQSVMAALPGELGP